MAKEHAVARIDDLLALDAEAVGAAAAASAAPHLARIPSDVEIKAAVVLADDIGGGWTNRFTTEASVRFPGRGALKRPFATALVWTSEAPRAERIRAEVLAAIYRVAHQQRHGLAASLAAMLTQEGLAGVFAGAQPNLHDPELAAARRIIADVGPNPAYPTTFACMYGDAAAAQLGYQPLGLPARAGFDVALADALERRVDPVAELSGVAR
jgi:hypothetical protein